MTWSILLSCMLIVMTDHVRDHLEYLCMRVKLPATRFPQRLTAFLNKKAMRGWLWMITLIILVHLKITHFLRTLNPLPSPWGSLISLAALVDNFYETQNVPCILLQNAIAGCNIKSWTSYDFILVNVFLSLSFLLWSRFVDTILWVVLINTFVLVGSWLKCLVPVPSFFQGTEASDQKKTCFLDQLLRVGEAQFSSRDQKMTSRTTFFWPRTRNVHCPCKSFVS